MEMFFLSYVNELCIYPRRFLEVCLVLPKTLSFQSQRKAMPKNAQITTIALISRASKGMLKILEARLQQYVNRELPDVQAGFQKGRGTRDQIANIC